MKSLFRRFAGNAGWTLTDQVLSALSNFALSVLLARTVDAAAFGAFAIAFLVYTMAISVERAITGQPLQIRHSGDPIKDFRTAAAHGLGAVAALGTAFGFASIGAGLLIGGDMAAALVPMGIFFPLLLLQDAARMAWFALSRPREATLLDAIWTVLLFGLAGVALALNLGSLPLLVGLWGVTAAVSAFTGLGRLRVLPRFGQALRWMREHRQLAGYLFAEYAVGLGAAQVAILVAGFITTATEVGSLRAAQTLLGPMSIIGAATFAFAIPELSRRPHLGARVRTLTASALSLTMGGATVVYLLVLLVIPDPMGRQLFGDTWAGARAVIVPMGLSSIASALGSGPGVLLYAMGKANLTFRINLIKSPLVIVAVLAGAGQYRALGAALGLCVCEFLMLPAWIWTMLRAIKNQETQQEAGLSGQPGENDA